MVDEKPKKCPACEIERLSFSPLEAFVLGVTLGHYESGAILNVSARICKKHRARFSHACVQATAKMQEDRNAAS
jgi:hypothetical protein